MIQDVPSLARTQEVSPNTLLEWLLQIWGKRWYVVNDVNVEIALAERVLRKGSENLTG